VKIPAALPRGCSRVYNSIELRLHQPPSLLSLPVRKFSRPSWWTAPARTTSRPAPVRYENRHGTKKMRSERDKNQPTITARPRAHFARHFARHPRSHRPTPHDQSRGAVISTGRMRTKQLSSCIPGASSFIHLLECKGNIGYVRRAPRMKMIAPVSDGHVQRRMCQQHVSKYRPARRVAQ